MANISGCEDIGHAMEMKTAAWELSEVTAAKQSDRAPLVRAKTNTDTTTFSLPPDVETRFLEICPRPGKTRYE